MSKSAAGRNDPCPCGSGKKFKNCCLGKSLPKSDLSRKPLFARVTQGSGGTTKTFSAKLIQGKTKDIIEETFSDAIHQARASDLPPVPPSSELPPQELPKDYKPWTPPKE